jgi:MarR family transcriptional regulator, organic hydroperoxide resistance regulator
MADGPPDAAEDKGPVEGRYGFLIHRINAHLARLCNPMFRRWRVDIDMARMLAVLDEQGAMAAGDIVRVMALPQSTISHQLKRLETLGYVRRTPSERDSRIIIVSLSEAGQAVAAESNALSREATAVLEAALNGLDRAAFAAALARIDARLTELRSLGGAP